MGNCLIRQDKMMTMMIKVMKTNGEILEYKAPMKVHQGLSEYADHAISDVLPTASHLRHQADMADSRSYHLQPLPVASQEPNKNPGSTVRIKLVISKQELDVMLRKGGVSVGDLVTRIQKNGSLKETDHGVEDDGRWKPVLESIPESD